jgi:hypothetical protein
MSAGAIHLVTKAIEARLLDALQLAYPAGGAVTGKAYVGPLDDPSAAEAHLVLFLCRVTPSQSLRNAEHRVSAAPGKPDQVYQNALALDLHYMLTVGPRGQAGEAESLRLLGFALQALNDAPVLAGSAVAGETVRLSLDPLGLDEMSRVWALFPAFNYRTSVLYLASPVWIDPAAVDAPPGNVVSQRINANALERA